MLANNLSMDEKAIPVVMSKNEYAFSFLFCAASLSILSRSGLWALKRCSHTQIHREDNRRIAVIHSDSMPVEVRCSETSLSDVCAIAYFKTLQEGGVPIAEALQRYAKRSWDGVIVKPTEIGKIQIPRSVLILDSASRDSLALSPDPIWCGRCAGCARTGNVGVEKIRKFVGIPGCLARTAGPYIR
jgi:hypothetical protein